MNNNSNYKYIWRCAKCFNHFANISNMDSGILKQEKKCPKCKSLNILTLSNKEILIKCKLFDPSINGYSSDRDSSYTYPEF